jgi:hypothetical protein
MALVTAWRALLARGALGRAAAAVGSAWPAQHAPPGAAPPAPPAPVAPPFPHPPPAALHTSAGAAAGGAPGQGPPDPFTASLQSKTEAELLALLQKQLVAQAAAGGGEQEEEGESDGEGGPNVNPETGAARGLRAAWRSPRRAADHPPRPAPPTCPGEVGGPKGKEPTRFGDWERGGRAVDF